MKKIIIFFVIIIFLVGIKCFFIRPANPEVTLKLSLIKHELIDMGYSPMWFIISGKRDKLLTKLSYNNAKKGSQHLKGTAIDIEIIDIDGDMDFDKNDISIFEKANSIVEKKYPNLIGSLGTYIGPNSDWIEYHQVHIDTKGKSIRYNKKI